MTGGNLADSGRESYAESRANLWRRGEREDGPMFDRSGIRPLSRSFPGHKFGFQRVAFAKPTDAQDAEP